jgi:hypothetical protein
MFFLTYRELIHVIVLAHMCYVRTTPNGVHHGVTEKVCYVRPTLWPQDEPNMIVLDDDDDDAFKSISSKIVR